MATMSNPAQQTKSSVEHPPTDKIPTGIPNYQHWTRYANIVLILVLAVMTWGFFMLSFLNGLGSSLKMPIIYTCTFAVGVAATLFSLGGTGHRVYNWCLAGGIVSLIAAIILFNTQVYLYTISISVLGWSTTGELFSYYHFIMILVVILLFVTSFISLTNAVYIRRQTEWQKKNQLVWETDGTAEPSRKWPYPSNVNQFYPTNQYGGQQYYMVQPNLSQ